MPTPYIDSLVKKGKGTQAELEKKWEEAKAIAKDAGHDEDYDYITGIFKKMINESVPKTFKEYMFTESL